MVERLFTKRLISPEDIPPTRDDLKVIGTFNPGAVRIGHEVILLVRVAEAPVDQREGFHALPRWTHSGELAIDYLPEEEDILKDPRKVVDREHQLMRLKFVSHLRVVRLSLKHEILEIGQPFMPEGDHESYGVEDARITYMDGMYYVTYVSVSEHGACTSLASTLDFKSYFRYGPIFCAENKDVVLLPKKIDGRYVALHRPNTFQRFCKPEMWIARSSNLIEWGEHRAMWGGMFDWDNDRIGAGCPPIAVDGGWLEVYHGSTRAKKQGEVGAYCAGLMLLDERKPQNIKAITTNPVMIPEKDFEKEGFVPNVVFPTGIVEGADDRELWMYYGAADTHCGVVGYKKADLLAALSKRA